MCVGDVLGEKTDAIVNGVSSNGELQGKLMVSAVIVNFKVS